MVRTIIGLYPTLNTPGNSSMIAVQIPSTEENCLVISTLVFYNLTYNIKRH